MNSTKARPSVRSQDRDHLVGGAAGEVGLPRVGHLPRQIEQRLRRVIELRRQDRLARLGDAEPRAHVVERAGDGQRRRREHRGAGAIEHQLAHDPRHLDRQGAQEDAGAARLDEEHEGRIVGAQHDAQLVAQRGGAAAERGGVVRHGGAAADRFGERAERVEQDQAGFARRRQRFGGHPDAVVEQARRATGRGDACRRGATAAAGVGAQRAIERAGRGRRRGAGALGRLGDGGEEPAPGAVQCQRRALQRRAACP